MIDNNELLRKCAARWRGIADDLEQYESTNCDLCTAHANVDAGTCGRCPIHIYTRTGCCGTPYQDFDSLFRHSEDEYGDDDELLRKFAIKEAEFLESLIKDDNERATEMAS